MVAHPTTYPPARRDRPASSSRCCRRTSGSHGVPVGAGAAGGSIDASTSIASGTGSEDAGADFAGVLLRGGILPRRRSALQTAGGGLGILTTRRAAGWAAPSLSDETDGPLLSLPARSPQPRARNHGPRRPAASAKEERGARPRVHRLVRRLLRPRRLPGLRARRRARGARDPQAPGGMPAPARVSAPARVPHRPGRARLRSRGVPTVRDGQVQGVSRVRSVPGARDRGADRADREEGG